MSFIPYTLIFSTLKFQKYCPFFFRRTIEFSEMKVKHAPTMTTSVCKMACWAYLVAYSRFILHSAAQPSTAVLEWVSAKYTPHPPPPSSTSTTSRTARTSALSIQYGCIKTNCTFNPSPFSFLFFFLFCGRLISALQTSGLPTRVDLRLVLTDHLSLIHTCFYCYYFSCRPSLKINKNAVCMLTIFTFRWKSLTALNEETKINWVL